MPTIHDGIVQAFSDNYVRITEDNNTRITENLNRRITDDLLINQGYLQLYALPTLIPFTKRVFIKINGIWKQGFFFVKRNGIWQEPTKMYRNIINFWKRIY